MTQEEFKLHQIDYKAAHAALVAECQAKMAASKKLVKERLAQLRTLLSPPIPTPIEKRRKTESYNIQRAIKSRVCNLEGIRGWDIANAEVKFNNADDLLTFEVAIPKTQQS